MLFKKNRIIIFFNYIIILDKLKGILLRICFSRFFLICGKIFGVFVIGGYGVGYEKDDKRI